MKPNHYDFIDALRGYAILLVMAVHASQAAPDWVGVGRLIVDQGARGVQLFFVASALTLALSWTARRDGVLPFYIRRVMRIAPMFWLGIVFFLWLYGFGPRHFAPDGIDSVDVALTATFLHGWHPESITSVVPGGWSIAVEMTFYLLFPLLVFLVRGWISALVALLVTSVLGNAALGAIWYLRSSLWPQLSDDLVSNFVSLWFPTQLPVFIVGLLVYFAIRDFTGKVSLTALRILLLASIACMLVLALHPLPIRQFGITSFTAYGLCFGTFAFCLSQGAGSWLVNAPVRYLGKISFSAYLWHFAVLGTIGYSFHGFTPLQHMTDSRGPLLFLQLFAYVIVTTSILSSITYRLIERPMVWAGNRLIDRIRPARLGATAQA